MRFLCEYKPKKQPVLVYRHVTQKAVVDHKTKRIQLRQDTHIFELTLPNIASGMRDVIGKMDKAINQLCDGIYNAIGRLLVPACCAV